MEILKTGYSSYPWVGSSSNVNVITKPLFLTWGWFVFYWKYKRQVIRLIRGLVRVPMEILKTGYSSYPEVSPCSSVNSKTGHSSSSGIDRVPT